MPKRLRNIWQLFLFLLDEGILKNMKEVGFLRAELDNKNKVLHDVPLGGSSKKRCVISIFCIF
jgi:hypothetical protein